MNVDVLIYYRHINFVVPKVLKCPLIFKGDGTSVPSFLNPRQNTGALTEIHLLHKTQTFSNFLLNLHVKGYY